MIHTMLLNPAYAGQAIFGRRQCLPWQPPFHPPRGHTGLPKRPYRQVPAPAERHISVAVPAIVDEGLFARAAERLEENRRRNRERLSGVHYLLRGLLVCQSCGYGFTGHHHRGQWRYYRCCGTDRSRFHGEFRCDARLLAVELLDEAIWAEVCRLLENPALVIEEYQRRLDTLQAHPHQLELDALARQLAKVRRAIDRLIDSYTEGLIEKPEFEPRIAELRRRLTRLEAQASEQQLAEEQARSLQRVIGKLDLFAAMVRDRLGTADWSTKREIICLLVKRIEVAKDVVRVVFRVDPSSSAQSEPRQRLPHCPTRRRHALHAEVRPIRSCEGCHGLIPEHPSLSRPKSAARRPCRGVGEPFRLGCCTVRSRPVHRVRFTHRKVHPAKPHHAAAHADREDDRAPGKQTARQSKKDLLYARRLDDSLKRVQHPSPGLR